MDSLVAMIGNTTAPSDKQPGKLRLLDQLREDSEFLEDRKERLIPIWEQVQIFSFCETDKTPSVTKV